MRFIRRLPAETKQAALVLGVLFAVVAAIGGTRLQGQTTIKPTSSASSASVDLCGNGRIDAGEQCDEASRNGNGPICTSTCTKVMCGDGIVSRMVNEECDSGVYTASGSFSSGAFSAKSTSSAPVCGARICAVAACDAKGKCTGGCRWQIQPACPAGSGSSLSASGSSQSSLPKPTSILPASSATSQVQSSSSSYSSAPMFSPPSSFAPKSAATVASTPFGLPTASSAPAAIFSFCGDSVVQEGEECDDGNLTEDDGCSIGCTVQQLSALCGNSRLNPEETCDEGADNSNLLPDACRLNCQMASCGDGVRDTKEQCDAGILNSDTEPNACRRSCFTASCGDGVVDAGEECDDGNATDADSCTVSCVTVCPEGAVKDDSGQCIESCGIFCTIGGFFESVWDWVAGWF